MTRPSGLSLVSFMLLFSLVAGATIAADRPALASTPGAPGACAPVAHFSLLLPASGVQLGASAVTLTWEAAANANDYAYQLSRNPNFAPQHWYSVGNVASAAHKELLSNGVWYWRVRAWNRGPDCAVYRDSEIRSFQVLVPPPAAPAPARPPANYKQQRTELELRWEPVPGAIGYAVYVDDDPDFGTPYAVDDLVLPRATVGPLSQGLYYWRVRAFDPAGNAGAYSATRDVTIGTCDTPDPGILLVSPTAGQITPIRPVFRWLAPAWSSDSEFEIFTIPPTWNVNWLQPPFTSFRVGRNTSTYTLTNPLAEGNYVARMRGRFTDNGCDIFGEFGATTPFLADVPGGAPNLIDPPPASRINTGPRPVIKFGAIAGALAYQVQFSDLATSAIIATREGTAADASCAAGPGTTCGLAPLSGLLPGAYTVRVRGSTTVHPNYTWGALSQPVWIDTHTCTQAAPVLLSPGAGAFTNDATPAFSWQALPNAGDYALEVKPGNFGPAVIDVPLVGSTSFTPTVPLPDGLYRWRVRGTPVENCADTGIFSPYQDVTIDTVPPAAAGTGGAGPRRDDYLRVAVPGVVARRRRGPVRGDCQGWAVRPAAEGIPDGRHRVLQVERGMGRGRISMDSPSARPCRKPERRVGHRHN